MQEEEHSGQQLRLLGLWLGWWPSLEEGSLGGSSFTTRPAVWPGVGIGRVWPPLRSSWPGNLAGEAPGHQPGRGILSVVLLCLLLLCVPEAGIRPRGSGLGPPSALLLLSF